MLVLSTPLLVSNSLKVWIILMNSLIHRSVKTWFITLNGNEVNSNQTSLTALSPITTQVFQHFT